MERSAVSSVTIGLITFGCAFGGVLAGAFIRKLLPQHHLREDSRDVVKLGTGLVATLTALVLAFLISSAKSSYDAVDDGLTSSGTDIILLDRVLRQYGPQTNDARQLLRRTTASLITSRWPECKLGTGGCEPIDALSGLTGVHNSVLGLSPSSDVQRSLQSEAVQLTVDLRHSRLQMIERNDSSLPLPFLIMLVFWLTVLFASFGMLAPLNTTNVAVHVLCAVSVAGAIFLLEEMSHPMAGIMKVSSTPLVKALEILGK
jgi:hypothetical protein